MPPDYSTDALAKAEKKEEIYSKKDKLPLFVNEGTVLTTTLLLAGVKLVGSSSHGKIETS